MNRLAVSISILAVMAVGSTAAVWATDRVATDMTLHAELAERAFVSGETEQCVAHAEELSERWDSVLRFSVLITDLGHALEITSSIAELRSHAENNDEELTAACARAKAQIALFRDMQLPTLWKIL